MRRRILWSGILISAAAGLLFLIGLVVWERDRGKHRLRGITDRLRESGVTLDNAKFLTQDVPDAVNGAVPLLEIAEELRAFVLPADLSPPPSMKITAPGQATSFVTRAGWPASKGDLQSWDRLGSVAEEARGLMSQLASIASRPRFASKFDLRQGLADMELKTLSPMPAVIRVARTTALLELHEGHQQAAADVVTAFLNFYCNKAEDPLLIAQLVRWSQARVALTLTWELLQGVQLSDDTWQSLQRAWERCRFLEDYERACRSEIAGIADLFARLRASATYRRHVLDNFEKIEADVGATWNPPWRGWMLRRVHLPAWRLLWADQDFAESLDYAAIEHRLARLATTNSWDSVHAEAARLGHSAQKAFAFALLSTGDPERRLYDRFRYLFSSPPAAFEGSRILRAFEAQTEATLAITALALQRFRRANDHFPHALSDLVPRFLSSIPTDPMDGGFLKYRMRSEMAFLLYSSGANGTDEGGDGEWTDEAAIVRSIWSGRDALWPAALDDK